MIDILRHEVSEEQPKQVELVLDSLSRLYRISERLSNKPTFVDWMSLTDEHKAAKIQQDLSREVLDWRLVGDHRQHPVPGKDPNRTPYGNFIGTWPGQYLDLFGPEKYDQAVDRGDFDQMINELFDLGALESGIDLKSSVISVSASTGSTMTPWQHKQSLDQLVECRSAVSGLNTYSDISQTLENRLIQQEREIAEVIGITHMRDGVMVRGQSGTDLLLLGHLFDVTETMLMEEGGTGGKDAASGRHTSEVGWMGQRRKKIVVDPRLKVMMERAVGGWDAAVSSSPAKLVGLETVSDATEFPFRRADGTTLSESEIERAVDQWVNKSLARHDENEKSGRIMLGVTIGGKTGLGIKKGGLSLEAALRLREKYGDGESQKVLITVDLAQGRYNQAELDRLLELGVKIDFTGSKADEGPMFSGISYIPPAYVQIARECVATKLTLNPNFLSGIGEYYTRGDLRALLDDETILANLPDIPNIPSLLNWAPVVAAKKDFNKLSKEGKRAYPQLMVELRRRTVNKLNKIGWEKGESGEWIKKNINGHTYMVEPVEETPVDLSHPRAETLVPFRVYVDGRLMSIDFMKRLRDEAGLPGQSGVMLQIGQYVEKADVDRIAFGLMTEIEVVRAFEQHRAPKMMDELTSIISNKLSEVIEAELLKLPRIENNVSVRKYNVGKYWRAGYKEYAQQKKVEWETKFETQTPDIKYEASKILVYEMLRDEKLMPVVLLSGKNLASLHITHEAWVKSKLERISRENKILSIHAERLQSHNTNDPDKETENVTKLIEEIQSEKLALAFVDHPFVRIDKNGRRINVDREPSDYKILAQSLEKYENTQLHIWQASDELINYLEIRGLSGKYVICSRLRPDRGITKEEYLDPNWYMHPDELSTEFVESINRAYKTHATNALNTYFCDLAKALGKQYMVVRGLGMRGDRRVAQEEQVDNNRELAADAQQIVGVAASDDYLGLHPLFYFNDRDLEWLLTTYNIPNFTDHYDHLKQAAKKKACGLDQVYRWDYE